MSSLRDANIMKQIIVHIFLSFSLHTHKYDAARDVLCSKCARIETPPLGAHRVDQIARAKYNFVFGL